MSSNNSSHKAQTTESASLRQLVKALPKIELHRHFEGSWRLDTLAEVARKYQIDLPGYTIKSFQHLVQMMPGDPPSMETYLSKFRTLRQFYKAPEVIERVAYENVHDAALDNVRYMELRFTPIALASLMNFKLADVVDWVVRAIDQGQRDFGIKVRLIISMNRHESPDLGMEFVELAIANMDRGVVAVDLAGAEATHSAEPFIPVFRRAREAGLNVTIHAGEWGGPANIRMAIEEFGARRIGHGVRVLEDSAVTQLALDQGIAFEVCPTSNFQSGVFTGWETHPLRFMYDRGLRTTINTDNTLVSAIELTDEAGMAMRYLRFTVQDIRRQMANAAAAAYLPDDERAELVQSFGVAFDEAISE